MLQWVSGRPRFLRLNFLCSVVRMEHLLFIHYLWLDAWVGSAFACVKEPPSSAVFFFFFFFQRSFYCSI